MTQQRLPALYCPPPACSFSLGVDSSARALVVSRKKLKVESLKGTTALSWCYELFSVMGMCQASAPLAVWFDLDLDQSRGTGQSNAIKS